MQNFVLSNIVLNVPFDEDTLSLCFRTDGTWSLDEIGALRFSGTVDFLTYFNALSLRKWHQYTCVQDIRLQIKLESSDEVFIGWHSVADKGSVSLLAQPQLCTPNDDGIVDVPVPSSDAALLGFFLDTNGSCRLLHASFYAIVPDEHIRRVELAVCTTTFRKEAYIEANIQAIKQEVLASNDALASHFRMFVVDNGRTLDVEALSCPGITIIPNANVGGSGGFARGMLEALDYPTELTHVLLMDDDVKMSPESFKRIFALLSLARDAYADAFVEGAMLKMEEPTVLFEDVAYVNKTGVYQKIKPDLHVDKVRDLLRSETENVEVNNAYGAWWLCCIPLAVVRQRGLPLPLFVRCDDVEFGLRNQPTIMSMNGVCVWHEGFNDRFRPSVDCYHYVRNFLIMSAVDGVVNERLFLARTERKLRLYLRMMNYGAVELLLDGWEDYLRGPAYLKQANGEEIMKEKAAKNERLVPVAELDQRLVAELPIDEEVISPDWVSSRLLGLWRTLPYDRHFLPDSLLRSKPAAICVSGCAKPSLATVACTTLVALDRTAENGIVRTMDRDRYRTIKKRWKHIKQDHKKRGAQVAAEWRAAKEELTSTAFWRDYLEKR